MTVRGPLIEPREPHEHLTEADQAARREAEHLAGALAAQAMRAQATAASQPGICSNCLEPCLPCAVYCDEDCQGDHEHRLAVARRLRGG